MPYIPHTPEDVARMLRDIGVGSLEELFQDIPEQHLLRSPLNLPPPLAEADLLGLASSLEKRNTSLENLTSFLGAGSYHHYIPSAVKELSRRGEFYTAYTPYQPEVSQGTLQVIFEFQSYLSLLTGMDVTNASHYDGATSLAEGALMAAEMTQRELVICSRGVHPHYRQVLRTYLAGKGVEYYEIPLEDGITSLSPQSRAAPAGRTASSELAEKLRNAASVIVQYPNFLGRIEPLEELVESAHQGGCLFHVSVVEPVALGFLTPPGEFGADIVTGEGQSLGLPPSFGGPTLGYMATREQHVRRLPGRLVGMTTDREGRTGFVLTLQTREQHIRRERASSNICTNQSLCALVATIFMGLLGKEGFREMARHCYLKAHYAFDAWKKSRILSPLFQSPFFHEFVMKSSLPPGDLQERLLQEGILAGYSLEEEYPEFPSSILFCVTEVNKRDEIDRVAALLSNTAQPAAPAVGEKPTNPGKKSRREVLA